MYSVWTLSDASPVYGQWEQTSFPDTAEAISIAVSGDAIIVGTFRHGVFRSTDDGSTWDDISFGLPTNMITTLLASGMNLFCGTYDHGLFYSTNSGNDWNRPGSGTDSSVDALALMSDSVGALELYAATSGDSGYGVYLSTDSGSSWTEISTGLETLCMSPTCRVTALETCGSYIYAGTLDRGIYRSSDQGANWTAVSDGLKAGPITDIVVAGSNIYASLSGESGGVFRSTNDGVTWMEVSGGLTCTEVWSLTIADQDIYSGTGGGGIFHSSVGDEVWNAINEGLTRYWITDITANDTYLFAGLSGYRGGLWRRSLVEVTGVMGDVENTLPDHLSLAQNYPNPFNSTTEISYKINQGSFASISVYDILGRLVQRTALGYRQPGVYRHTLTLEGLGTGVFTYCLTIDQGNIQKRMLLIR
jgi:photosystem II stability/assembly factor-like uncharacterized protein